MESNWHCSVKHQLSLLLGHYGTVPGQYGTVLEPDVTVKVYSQVKKEFVCDICNEKIVGKHNFGTHMDQVHRGIEEIVHPPDPNEPAWKKPKRSYKCGSCHKIFESIRNIRQHVDSVHR